MESGLTIVDQPVLWLSDLLQVVVFEGVQRSDHLLYLMTSFGLRRDAFALKENRFYEPGMVQISSKFCKNA